MKKTIITAIFVTILLTSCGSSKFVKDMSNMSEEQRQHHENLLVTAKENYNIAKNQDEKVQFTEEIAFQYMALGQYSNAIPYYEEVLNYDAVHYPALNNLAVMYEEMDEIETALKYQQRLYEANSTDTRVVKKTIKLLVGNLQFDNAQGVLETFARTDVAKTETQFISDQFEFIQNEKQKAIKK